MAKKLNARHKKFADEYLKDLNATAAYIRAGYKAKGGAAEASAARLLRNAKVSDYIQKRMQDREQRTEITQDMVLKRWWSIATADPNELIYYRRVCCRYCFGHEHEYQWVDENEYLQAVQIAKAEQLPEPTSYGGFGFDPTIRPHPKCPKCHGEGHGQVQAQDTRDLSEQAKMLYAGVKVTQAGFEIKMHDQDKALENVARHLGMFIDRHEHSGKDGVPINVMFNIPRPPKPNKGD